MLFGGRKKRLRVEVDTSPIEREILTNTAASQLKCPVLIFDYYYYNSVGVGLTYWGADRN